MLTTIPIPTTGGCLGLWGLRTSHGLNLPIPVA